MNASVVICAHTEERWEATLAAVESVRAQRRPALETLLVVDHNPVLLARLGEALPDVRVMPNQEERGLSGGRNTGIANARGDIVAFLDDDAVAHPLWLSHFAQAYADPAVVAVGGLTLPNWETRRPSWFPREFDWVLGCTYEGMPTSPAPVRNVMGGNASYRREALVAAGGFRQGIGRCGHRLPLGCEETELCIRMRQRSPQSVLLFDNRAVIWHLIPAERCRFAYFGRRCYAEGLSKALVTANVGAGDGLSSERGYVRRTLPLGVVGGVLDAVRGRPAGLARAGAIVAGLAATTAGYAVGTIRQRRPPREAAAPLAVPPPGRAR